MRTDGLPGKVGYKSRVLGAWLCLTLGWLLGLGLGVQGDVPTNRTSGGQEAALLRWRFVGGTALAGLTEAQSLSRALSLKESGPTSERFATNLTREIVGFGRTRYQAQNKEKAEAQAEGENHPDDPVDIERLVARILPLTREMLRNPSRGEYTREGWWFAVQNSQALVRTDWFEGLVSPINKSLSGATEGWTVIASDPKWRARATTELSGATEEAEKEASDFLELDIRLGAIFGDSPNGWRLPDMRWRQFLTNDTVRVHAEFDFPEPLNMELEPWTLPKSEIRPPLVQFLAVRGIRPFIEGWPELSRLFQEVSPNQFTLWGQPLVPFRTWFSLPIDPNSATNVLQAVHERLTPWFDGSKGTNGSAMGRLVLAGNQEAVAIQDIERIIHPVLGKVEIDGQSYLYGSFFQPAPSTQGMPEGLEAQLDRSDLVYYDFEITEEAVMHWGGFIQFGYMMLGRLPSARNAVAQKWLQSAVEKAGETVTEIVQTSEQQLVLRRRGPFGLNAMEWVALVRWLDGPVDRVRLPTGLPSAPATAPGSTRSPVPRGERQELRKPRTNTTTLRQPPGTPATRRRVPPATPAPAKPQVQENPSLPDKPDPSSPDCP